MYVRRNVLLALTLASSLALTAGCGNSDKGGEAIDAGTSTNDAAPDPDAYRKCGDGQLSQGEVCDEGNSGNGPDGTCSDECELNCGDGLVNAVELCDTGITAGDTGACPTECPPPSGCTSSVLVGETCTTECRESTTTATIDDDGCCPVGADSLSDNDCTAICDNGVVEAGETCDTAIAKGSTGACAVTTDCVDGNACTTDTLINEGTCTAECTNPDITAPTNGDGCCPDGATIETDDDCAGVCGDGTVTPPEQCDTAIASGITGACPAMADCVDGNVCTRDVLSAGGTCNAVCSNPAITTFINDDGCCPPGATEVTDNDCTPECGNNAIETGETCDDGDTDPGDGCDENCQIEILPTAFRVKTLELRDPHVFADVIFFGCTDGNFSINPDFQSAVDSDSADDDDDLLDLSILSVFRPLAQTMPTTPLEVHISDCTAPIESTTCAADPAAASSTATNLATGTCLAPLAGTLGPYTMSAPNTVTGPCYSSASETISLSLSGIDITLTDARIAGTYVGNPATEIVNGLIRGFISETQAEGIILPDTIAFVGGQTLASVLAGGTGSCPAHDDRDMGPGGESGWYFYLNFTAAPVTFTE